LGAAINMTVNACAADMSVRSEGTGAQQTGSLVGVNHNSEAVCDSYYDQDTTGQSDTGKGEPRPTAEMKRQGTYTGWDFDTVWSIDEGESYPYLRQLINPY